MTAIYQRARPFTFDQVVGQEHVKNVLVSALERDRITHAYLFSGPRGVGKTTTARLLAMAVNCETPNAHDRPCGACESCSLVRRNAHPDVIELDAASNNSVEDIRDLREKVRLSSLRGGKRVWVLDEAHMLSKAAANALLKTLEEPPSNLVFVLATTEPEKLPPTILSRCQHFRFRRLSEREIGSKLERLCADAGVEAEPEALSLVARAADGAMRDAESLLERLLAPGGAIRRQDAEAALGLPPRERMIDLAASVCRNDVASALASAGSLYADGFAPRSLVSSLASTLRDALVERVRGDDAEGGDGTAIEGEPRDLARVVHALDDEDERFTRRNDLFSLEVALIKAMNVMAGNSPAAALRADAVMPAVAPAGAPRGVDVPAAPAARPALPEFDPVGRGATQPRPARAATAATDPEAPSSPPVAVPSAAPSSVAPAAPASGVPAEPAASPQRHVAPTGAPAAAGGSAAKLSWHAVLGQASAQLKAFMIPAAADIDGLHVTLSFPEKNKFHYEQLKRRHDELEALASDVAGAPVRVDLLGPGETVRKKR